MNAQRTASAFRKNGKIATSLRCLYNTECVLLIGNLQVGGVIASDLEKHAAVWATLVGLSRGM